MIAMTSPRPCQRSDGLSLYREGIPPWAEVLGRAVALHAANGDLALAHRAVDELAKEHQAYNAAGGKDAFSFLVEDLPLEPLVIEKLVAAKIYTVDDFLLYTSRRLMRFKIITNTQLQAVRTAIAQGNFINLPKSYRNGRSYRVS